VQPLKHPSLSQAPSNFIDGRWITLAQGAGRGGGKASPTLVASHNPAHPDRVVWSGVCDTAAVDAAVSAARAAFPAWAKWGRDNRFRVLRKFAELCKLHTQRIAELICDETGKVMWEAKGEAAALSAKVDITLDTSAHGGLSRVNGFEFEMGAAGAGQKTARCWFKPHGVVGVLGPFNFPAHLPNGHIVPALAMGNTVVFKPSDKAPGVGQLLVELLNEALVAEHAPNQGRGVINLVQGGAPVASALSTHADIDGLLFTGSWPVGRRILEANLDRPGRIVALEMGGNNPAIVLDDADVKQAAVEIVRCAFNTTGQRCTCTRRVIVQSLIADRLLEAIVSAAENLVIADPRASLKGGVFMGPIINDASRQAVLEFQSRCEEAGGEILLPARGFEYVPPGHTRGEGFYVSPSIIRVDEFTRDEFDPKGNAKSFVPGCDHEVFGPLLRVCEVRSLDEALEQANATKYGLAASIFTTDQAAAERFLFECRAGCLNVNTGTAGASSKLPFGGLGHSGNHRPAGSFSLDYCAYPVAGMIERGQTSQLAEGMKWDETWGG
jgi:succinylglutamic semialdehyde dehydrogenase